MNWYEQQTTANPNPLRRFAHRARYRTALALIPARAGMRVLDYGMGDGSLLLQLWQRDPAADYTGYEPFPAMRELAQAAVKRAGASVDVRASTADLPSAAFDTIACTEVLEHLPSDVLDRALLELRRLLAPGGHLVVSVPVEIGPVSVVKNAVRLALRQDVVSLRAAAWCAVGLCGRVERPVDNGYIHTHLGFDFRQLRPAFARHGLAIRAERYSPLGVGLGWANSQVFWTLNAV